MDRSEHRFTLLGTGSSGGVPRVGGAWGDCDPNEPRNYRRRCGALVDRIATSGEMTRVLIDTSPDLREQLLRAKVERLDGIVFTHDHADQTHGIDDVRALAISMRQTIPTWMDEATSQTLTTRFGYCFEGKGGYPPILDQQPAIQPHTPIQVTGAAGTIEMLPLDQEHGRIRSLGFRMGGLAYCNDVNALPDDTLAALGGLDILIIDALRRDPHPTHAHLDQTLEWIRTLAPKRAVLTNMHIDLDYQTLREELPEGVEPGYDGMVLSFSP